MSDNAAKDEFYEEVARWVHDEGRVCVSHVQRRLRIGYNRAQHICDELEAAGVIVRHVGLTYVAAHAPRVSPVAPEHADHEGTCPLCYEEGYRAALADRAQAVALEPTSLRQGEAWISFKDRSPEPGQRVIYFDTDRGPWIGTQGKPAYFTRDIGFHESMTTHWMPFDIPAPPIAAERTR